MDKQTQNSSPADTPVAAKVESVRRVEPAQPGFAGPNHTAASVIAPGRFDQTNPFILMMDDRLSGAGPLGEEHPHAGLETVTFIVRGRYSDVEGELEAGDLSWMTAGRGIIHSEGSQSFDDLRLLQTWLTLADGERDIPPRVQTIKRSAALVRREPGVVAHLYSGRSGDLIASPQNSVPTTFVDVAMQPGARFEQVIPGGHAAFVYVLEGAGALGEKDVAIDADDVAWLKLASQDSLLSIVAGRAGLRVLLLTGQRQKSDIVTRGPFVAETTDQLSQQAARFRSGGFERSSALRASK